jgi:hypothetical protein
MWWWSLRMVAGEAVMKVIVMRWRRQILAGDLGDLRRIHDQFCV